MQEPRFSILGIPVRVTASFAFVALMGLTSGSFQIALLWVAIVFVTTLVHELGHALAFKAYGRRSSITLWGLGGLTHGEGAALSRGKNVVVSLAGPLTEIILVGLPALYLAKTAHPSSALTALAYDLLVWVGIGWALVNLLPVLPLDGGRVVANVLEGLYGIKGARAARWIGMGVAAAAATFAATRGFIFGAFFGLFFIAQNRNDLQRLRDVPSAERLAEGHERLDVGDAQGAAIIAEEVAAAAKNPLLVAAALHLLAWAHLVAGRRAEAAAALERLPDDIRPSRSIIAYTLLRDGHREEALDTAVSAMIDGDAGLPPNAQLPLLLEKEGLLGEVADRLLASAEGDGAQAIAVLVEYLRRAGKEEAAMRLEERIPQR